MSAASIQEMTDQLQLVTTRLRAMVAVALTAGLLLLTVRSWIVPHPVKRWVLGDISASVSNGAVFLVSVSLLCSTVFAGLRFNEKILITAFSVSGVLIPIGRLFPAVYGVLHCARFVFMMAAFIAACHILLSFRDQYREEDGTPPR
jgi:hypothetical protein